MSNEIPAQAKPGQGSAYRSRKIMQKWPLLVWIGVLGLVIFLYSKRGVAMRINGMVTAHSEEISAPEDGVILNVHVNEGDKVTKGQELVILDPSLIQKELEDFKANLPFVRADMARKFKSTRFGINADLQNAKTDRALAESRLDTAKRNAELIKKNVEQQLRLQSELDSAEAKIEALKAELTTHEESIQELNKDLSEADELIATLDTIKLPDELLVLNQKLKNKTLVAPGDGLVQKLHKMRGVAKLGEPILTISLISPDKAPAKTIRGLVSQDQNPEKLQVDEFVWISERKKNPVAMKSKILAVSPGIEALPNYGTFIQGQYIRGRVFVCELPKDLENLLPGTGVHIHLNKPGKFDFWSFGRTPVKSASN